MEYKATRREGIIYLKWLSAECKQYTRIKSNIIELTDSALDDKYLAHTVNVRQKPTVPTLQVPLRLGGVRIDCSLFTEHTGIEIFAEYPQPIHHFLTICTSELDYREGAFGILGFGRKTKGLEFAIVLGFINFMGPCCKILRDFDEGSHTDKLRFAFERCEPDSLAILAPDDTIRFPTGEPGAITMWKEEVNGEAIVIVRLHSQQSLLE